MWERENIEGKSLRGATDTEITHDLLIMRARYWLENTVGAKVVLTEIAGGAVGGARRSRRSNREIPDAIGWLRSGVSLLIECKASRADFLSDAAYAILTRPSRECSGNLFIDEDVLAEEGVRLPGLAGGHRACHGPVPGLKKTRV